MRCYCTVLYNSSLNKQLYTNTCFNTHTHTHIYSLLPLKSYSICCVFLPLNSHVTTTLDLCLPLAGLIASQGLHKGLANHSSCIIGTFLTFVGKRKSFVSTITLFCSSQIKTASLVKISFFFKRKNFFCEAEYQSCYCYRLSLGERES